MNEFGEYFCGLYKGDMVWLNDIKESKELNDLHKYESMKRFVNFEIIYEFI